MQKTKSSDNIQLNYSETFIHFRVKLTWQNTDYWLSY